MNNEQALASLIGRIYDAGVGADNWAATLDAIKDAIGAEAAALFVQDRQRSPTTFDVTSLRGYPDDAAEAYATHFAVRDIRIPAFARLAAGEAYVDDRTMPFAEILGSEIYNDFYRPFRVAYGIGVKPFNEPGRTAILSAHRAIGASNFDLQAIKLFECVSPHIARALQLQRQMAQAQARAGALSVALDHFPLSVLLTDDRGQIVELNRTAEALLSRPTCPLRIANKRLVALSATDSDPLNRAIAAAQATLRGGRHTPPPVLRLTKTDGNGNLGIMAVPARHAALIGVPADRMVLIFISDPDQAPLAVPELLQGQFGLSPTEARVAARLVAGGRIEDIAEAHAVSQETVRVQVKRVFAKTDTHHQGQLIGLISRSLAVLLRRQD